MRRSVVEYVCSTVAQYGSWGANLQTQARGFVLCYEHAAWASTLPCCADSHFGVCVYGSAACQLEIWGMWLINKTVACTCSMFLLCIFCTKRVLPGLQVSMVGFYKYCAQPLTAKFGHALWHTTKPQLGLFSHCVVGHILGPRESCSWFSALSAWGQVCGCYKRSNNLSNPYSAQGMGLKPVLICTHGCAQFCPVLTRKRFDYLLECV